MIERTQLWLGGGFLVCITAALVCAFEMLDSSQEFLTANQREAAPAGYEDLQRTLTQRARTWNPRERERLLAKARERAHRLEAAIQWVLAHGNHELAGPTLELAADLELLAARPLMVSLVFTGPARLRPKAVRCAARLGPWSRAELAELLAATQSELRIAALDVCQVNDDRPTDDIVRLLGDESSEVREAALRAMPDLLAPSELAELLLIVDHGGEMAATALRAMARIQWTRRTEQLLMERLPTAPESAQCAILEAMATRGAVPDQPGLLWELVTDTTASPKSRAMALWCLEATESFDPDALRQEHAELPHMARYFAARCLLEVGDSEGVAILLELAEPAEASGEADPEQVKESGVAAKQLLARLSNTPLHAGLDAWRAWYSSHSEVEAQALPAPPLSR